MKTSLALLSGVTTALAAVKGFNYGAQGQSRAQFDVSFKTAQNLKGANGFNGARLYTMIQEGTSNTPIEAIPAAIDTNTTLLLGLWASSPQATFDNEIAALKNAISQYGSQLAKLVTGISVGSEDLYRISSTGIANDPLGVGQSPSTLVNYIRQVRDVVKGTSLSNVPIGHVDTWNAFVNGSNSAVISACDFLGLDEYPYYQTTDSNGIENAKSLFFEAYDKVAGVASGKQIWITEAGWPVSGKQSGLATASVDNAARFWQDVACELENRNINFWWYILEDSATPSFSVSQGGQPLYDLSCKAVSKSTNSTSSASRNSTASATGSSVSGSASTTRSGTGSMTTSPGSRTTGSGNLVSTGSGSATASVSSYANGARKIGGVAALVLAGVVAALL